MKEAAVITAAAVMSITAEITKLTKGEISLKNSGYYNSRCFYRYRNNMDTYFNGKADFP